jgi:PAS domain S-box-containing protein
MLLLWGPKGVAIYNDAFSAFLGDRHPALLGARAQEGWLEGGTACGRMLTAALAGRPLSLKNETLEIQRRGIRGTFSLNLESGPVPGPDGSPAGVLVVVTDTSESRQADALAKETERQFRILVQGVADYAIIMLDPAGRIASWNPGAERIKGYRLEEILGEHFSKFYTEEDRAAGVPARALATAALSGKYESEGWRVRKDGTRFWTNAVIDAIRGPDGSLLGFAKVTRDVTERRQAQQALEEAREALFQSQKMEAIGQLTGGVAHDFNNMLAGIIGAMELLRRRLRVGRYAETERYVEAAIGAANRAAALTARLLAFGRRQSLDVKPLEVNAIVSSMVELLRRTMGERIQVETRLRPDLWSALTDANQAENALLNLAINARDAMPDGGKLTITSDNVCLDRAQARAFGDLAPGDYVVLQVTDTGKGMSPDILSKAFEPFFTTKPLGQGTGLGLSMIYGFAKQIGGHVRMTSEVDRGTSVFLYLPRSRVAGSEDPAIDGAEVPQGAGETVLVVEDDQAVRMLVAEILAELGYGAIEVNDAKCALPVLAGPQRIDLLITDVGLPGAMNGRQLAEEARRLRPGLKTLFVTGYAEGAASRGRFLEPGMDLIPKPFTLETLASKIRAMIQGAYTDQIST